MKKRYVTVALLLVGITVLSLGLTALFGVAPVPKKADEFSVVASFYPVYTAALQVVGDCEGVSVSCLTQPTTGCIHDYQLSPEEMKKLNAADVLVLNGAGAEGFLSQATAAFPELSCIDTTQGLSLLETVCEHDHEHNHEEEHDHTVNEHAWLSPALYAEQVRLLCEGLCRLNPDNAAAYRVNAAAYITKIKAVGERLAGMKLPFTHAVLFHNSVAYPAHDLGLAIAGVIPLGEEQSASAALLAETARNIEGKAVLFLYDNQFSAMHTVLSEHAQTAATVFWDSAARPIAGVGAQDVWLFAMEKNLQQLEEAAHE